MSYEADGNTTILCVSAHLLVDVSTACPLRRKLFQVIPNIPFTPATTGKRTRPLGNRLDIHPLFEQTLNVIALRATAMAHHFILLFIGFRFHLFWRSG